MNVKRKPSTLILLLSTLLLAMANTALAREIIVENVSFNLSDLAAADTDTITVRNNGTLLVNVSGTIAGLKIGDSTGPGFVQFPATATLTVAGNPGTVSFGSSDVGNLLDMSTSLTSPTLKVSGGFLTTGSGIFRAGSGTIEYNGTSAQSITAFIGGSGSQIQYKHLILSGSPSGNATAAKNFSGNVSVQGTLSILGKAAPSGSSVTYGPLASLSYGRTMTSTTTEWPASLSIPVSIASGVTITLDDNKTLGTAFPNSLILSGADSTLQDGGKTLTVLGGISNSGNIAGKGLVVLGGTSSQALTGAGSYGNVTLNNAAGAVLPGANLASGINLFNGRLTIQNGKFTLPFSTIHNASLLTFGGADKPGGTSPTGDYTTANSGSAFANPSGSGTAGILHVNAKPVAVVVCTNTAPSLTIDYGDASVTVGGTLAAPNTAPNFESYGNGAKNTETVGITISKSGTVVSSAVTSPNNGRFLATLATSALAKANDYVVKVVYSGGDNLQGYTLDPAATLVVDAKPIRVVPQNVAKTYGTVDPELPYTSDALIGSDQFTGKLSRELAGQPGGQNAGDYFINIGTLYLDPNKYTIDLDLTKKLSILKKPITVTIDNQTKVYGNQDPPLTYSYPVGSLLPGDSFVGSLTREKVGTPEGEPVGSYAIGLGNPAAGGVHVIPGDNYQLNPTAASLTITKRAITVTFANKAKVYGAADPTFTYSSSPGLAFSDCWNDVCGNAQGKPTRAAGETVSGGPYTIQQGTLSIIQSNNYIVAFSTDGKLTIGKKDVTVSARTYNKTYGDDVSVPGNLVTYAGFITASGGLVPPQSAPATSLPTLNPATPLTKCSVPNTYAFDVTAAGSDPNYNMILDPTTANRHGVVTVTPKAMDIVADNKTKVGNGQVYGTSGFTVSYKSFVCDDTKDNSFGGTLAFVGAALTATDTGVYQVTPQGLTSTKYAITFKPGWLSITAPPATNSTSQNVTWASSGAQAFMFTQPYGTPGVAWTLLKTSGQLIINAAPEDKFRIDLVTVVGGASARMPKFDPTRPYSWEIVQATGGIVGFAADKFTVNYEGAGLFANPLYNGKFSLRQDGTSVILDYTPMGALGNDIPAGYSVGSLTDPNTLLGDVTSHDLDALYLEAIPLTVDPADPNAKVTININVANLKQPIVGAEVYINFSSTYFIATPSGAGSPQVVAGGGVWDTPIFKMWNTGGDLDTVLVVNLNNAAGTADNGTAGKVILTPNRTATGKSRVVFRQDGGTRLDGGTLVTYLQPADPFASAVMPARVFTDEITVKTDTTGPSLNSYAATQAQPYVGTVNVKNGDYAHRTQVVRTSGDSGKVVITIDASDAGVGLSGPPTLTLKQSGQTDISIACTTPNAKVGPFVYEWTVPADAANGTWTASVTATDTINPPNSTTKADAFTVNVNTVEVTGVVELQSFAGTNRQVTFKAGDGNGTTAVKSWDVNFDLTSKQILSAGAYQNRAAMDTRVKAPTAADTLSTWLRYGDILNLESLAGTLKSPARNVDLYVDMLLYGNISSLNPLYATLVSAARSVDVFVLGELSQDTLDALNAYDPVKGTGGPALTAGILVDYTTICVSYTAKPGIYDPVRFASVTLSQTSRDLLAISNPSAAQVIALNRSLLNDAYPQYLPGQLDANTAERLSNYGGGADSTLMNGLLSAFDTMTLTPAMWPSATPPFVQCLYNEEVFLGVTLSSATTAKLTSNPTGNDLTLLNQMLLQDAYAGIFVKAPLIPATVQAIKDFNAGTPSTVTAFDSAMQADLNALINGPSIYTDARFAPWKPFIVPGSELDQLLKTSNPTASQKVRMNRLLLELGYSYSYLGYAPALSTSVLGNYRLVGVPSGTTEVSAKTAWNLRVRKTFSAANDNTANFVSDGATGWTDGSDAFLRGGDLTGDNIVDLADYRGLATLYGSPSGAPADINGDGLVDIADYSLLKLNYGKGVKNGDEVQ